MPVTGIYYTLLTLLVNIRHAKKARTITMIMSISLIRKLMGINRIRMMRIIANMSAIQLIIYMLDKV